MPPQRASHADLIVAVLAVLAVAALAVLVPAGSALRAVAALVVLGLAPGYLLQAAALARLRVRLATRVVLALGLSPVVVGLAALATGLVPGAFHAGPIMASVCAACIVLAFWARRRRIGGRVERRHSSSVVDRREPRSRGGGAVVPATRLQAAESTSGRQP